MSAFDSKRTSQIILRPFALAYLRGMRSYAERFHVAAQIVQLVREG